MGASEFEPYLWNKEVDYPLEVLQRLSWSVEGILDLILHNNKVQIPLHDMGIIKTSGFSEGWERVRGGCEGKGEERGGEGKREEM